MSVFKRLYNITRAETNAWSNDWNDPIEMFDDDYRKANINLESAEKALAEVKRMAIEAKRKVKEYKEKADFWENQAILTIKRAQNNEIAQQSADEKAIEFLKHKDKALENMKVEQKQVEQLNNNIMELQVTIEKLKADVTKTKNQLSALYARANMDDMKQNMDKEFDSIDTESTIGMLERMKLKIEQEEALSDMYAEIAEDKSHLNEELDSEIDEETAHAADALNQLKEKMARKKNE